MLLRYRAGDGDAGPRVADVAGRNAAGLRPALAPERAEA